MATPLQHILEGGDPDTGRRVLTYGKCEKSPYRENGLCFVYVPRIIGKTATFLVSEEHARPRVMDEFEIDFDKWSKVAHKTILGSDWNAKEECLWQDMPFYIHKFPDGTPVRYGLSRSQSEHYTERELWYIVIGLAEQKVVNWSNYPAFVVDKVCIEPAFMDKMGSEPERWRLICWSAPVGIEPWYATLDVVPDPYYVFKQDEAKASRSLWPRMIDKLFA